MAIITVSVADGDPAPRRWVMPPSTIATRSPVPQGLITFSGIDAIATLAAGNQTFYSLILTMPAGFAYLPRTVLLRYTSDSTVQTWDDTGLAFIRIDSSGAASLGQAGAISHGLSSPGVWNGGAANASRIWTPSDGSPKLVLKGGDRTNFELTDMDAGAGGQTAGDMSYWIDYYVFGIAQVDNWEVNTPIPVINHTAF